MTFYQRAINSILRQQSKSIILLLVSFILGSGIIISFLISSAISEATSVMLARSNSAVTLALGSNISEQKIKEIGNSPYVAYYDYNINSNVTSKLNHYEGDVKKYLSGAAKTTDYFDTNFYLTGVNDPELLLVHQQRATLVKGRVFNKSEITGSSNSIIVSETFAKTNNLGLNSKVVFSAAIQSDESNLKERSYELNVVGILKYENRHTQASGSEKDLQLSNALAQANFQNTLLVPNSITKQINQFLVGESSANNGGNLLTSTPVFILKSPYDLGNFIDEEASKLNKHTYFVSDYDKIKKSISSTTILNNIAFVSFVTMSILSIAVLSLIVVLFLVNRRQEFGIYKALGEKKYKTIAQVALEMCLIGLVGFTLAIASSSFMAQQVSQSIIKNTQVQNTTTQTIKTSDIVPYLDDSSINDNFIARNYQIRISARNVVYVISIGLITMLVASIGPSIYILRLKPKNILM